MPRRICYLGDDDLGQAAIYLAGIMTHFGLGFDHVPSTEKPPAGFDAKPYSLYVISDYPAGNFASGQLERLADRVAAGAGLAMFGGWESFHGRLGQYHRSPLADVLPVVMADADDRRNCAQPCLVNQVAEHPIVDGLPFRESPPAIGGFNAFRPKPAAELLLTAVQFSVIRSGEAFGFTRGEETPLLVVGRHGKGRTAALATDVAPHWVGGLVDWGDRRVVQALGDGFIDVGNWYARFFRNLLVWTGRIDAK
jgi:uncharacterized membrane protein